VRPYGRASGATELNIMGLRNLVYGGCALIVLACLGLAVWVLWP
jgi:hypothetical protein